MSNVIPLNRYKHKPYDFSIQIKNDHSRDIIIYIFSNINSYKEIAKIDADTVLEYGYEIKYYVNPDTIVFFSYIEKDSDLSLILSMCTEITDRAFLLSNNEEDELDYLTRTNQSMNLTLTIIKQWYPHQEYITIPLI